MVVVIDRFEGSYAVCESDKGEIINIEKNKIPGDAVEGDVLRLYDGEITIDRNETLKRKNEVDKLLKDLWE